MKKVFISFTGHRDLGNKVGEVNAFLEETMRQLILLHGYVVFICGGAMGVDTMAAAIGLRLRDEFKQTHPNLKVEVHLYLPFRNHDAKFPDRISKIVRMQMVHADEVRYIHDGEFTHKGLYQDRNKAMVDDSHGTIAIWDGNPGGTGNCVRYAQRVNQYLYHYNHKTGVLSR